MATDASTPATDGGSKSLAAMLEQQHADETHHATVEDVADEEDLKHLSTSSIGNAQASASTTTPVPESSTPAESASPSPMPKPTPKKSPAFDVQSEELFPALGSGPKPTAPAAATWGAKKPSAAATVANGLPPRPLGMW